MIVEAVFFRSFDSIYARIHVFTYQETLNSLQPSDYKLACQASSYMRSWQYGQLWHTVDILMESRIFCNVNNSSGVPAISVCAVSLPLCCLSELYPVTLHTVCLFSRDTLLACISVNEIEVAASVDIYDDDNRKRFYLEHGMWFDNRCIYFCTKCALYQTPIIVFQIFMCLCLNWMYIWKIYDSDMRLFPHSVTFERLMVVFSVLYVSMWRGYALHSCSGFLLPPPSFSLFNLLATEFFSNFSTPCI